MKHRVLYPAHAVLLRVAAAIVVSALMAHAPARAADYSLCSAGFQLPERPPVEVMPDAPGVTSIESDDADLEDEGLSILRGNVQIVRDSMQLSADEVQYSKTADTVDARGNVRLWEDGFYLTGSRGVMDVGGDTTVMDDADFQILESHGSGSARRLTVSGDNVLKAKDSVYTTCDPGAPDWELRAEDVKLDKGTDQGIARNVWVHFMDVPIFYSPFLSFPLSDARKSGFLAPSAGVSALTGAEVRVPYYFNILPNMDATVAVRGMSNRGVQLQGEYRYLFPFGSGKLGAEWLPGDSQTDSHRAGVSFQHRSTYASPSRWLSDVSASWVSDSEYFEDLGTSLSVSSRSFLEQRADLWYFGPTYWVLGRALGYHSVDRTIAPQNRPYTRLPQLLAQTTFAERNKRINVNARGELVYFTRRSSVEGIRLDLEPTLSYPIRSSAGFVVPSASLRYTGYSLSSNPTSQPDSPSRILPRFSLDSGVYFDRRLSLGGRDLVQTLEPRLYYLYVPFANQDDLPIFDTGEYTFTFAQLFRNDRFSSADRMADANQVSLALTTRFLSPRTGRELLRASVGQIRYLSDRKVTQPGVARNSRRSSDLVAEFSANIFDRWRAAAGLQWDTRARRVERNTVSLRYQPDSRRVANFSYRFIRNGVEQTDVSVAWPISRQWSAVGRWNYALPEKRTLEVFGGIEYESCCWGLRAVVRRYLANTRGEYNTAVFVQLELKGLSGVGDASEFLTKSIPGYQNQF